MCVETVYHIVVSYEERQTSKCKLMVVSATLIPQTGHATVGDSWEKFCEFKLDELVKLISFLFSETSTTDDEFITFELV